MIKRTAHQQLAKVERDPIKPLTYFVKVVETAWTRGKRSRPLASFREFPGSFFTPGLALAFYF